MFSLPSPAVCRKRKPNPDTPLCPRKRARLIGTFEPRCIVPTGARRSWTFAKEPRFILDPVTQGSKRNFIEEEEIPISHSNCKVRVLDNRDALFLPSYKRLSLPKKLQRKLTPSSSPVKKSVGLVRLRRREFLRKRQLQRADSGIYMESDDDLDLDLDILFEPMTTGDDIKLFDASTFTGFSVEMMEATETVTEDDMEIEDASISTATTSASTTEDNVADSDSTAAEQTCSPKDDKNEEPEKETPAAEQSGDLEVENTEKKIIEQKEANITLSAKDTVIKERIRKRLGADELVRLGPSSSKKALTKKIEEDEDDEEPIRRSTRRKSTKSLLPTTVEEEEEDEKEREDDDDGVVKKKSPRTSKNKEDGKEKKQREEESEEEIEKIEKKVEKKEKKKLARRKVKVEETESEADESEREDKKPKKKVTKQENRVEEEELMGDKMEEDTEDDANSSGEDTDMSTDEDIAEAIAEDRVVVLETVLEVIEEDVTMSEDDEMTEESPEEVSEDKKLAEEEINAETPAKHTPEVKDIEVTTSEEAESREEDQQKLQISAATVSVEVKKSVRRLVLAPSRQDELEAAKILSAPRTPRTPRSPNMSRFNITMSKAPRKLNPIMNPLLSPRRGKFNKSEDLSAYWSMKRLAARKRQQPFNPANISRHAYRDPIDGDEVYSMAARKALWEDDEAEEAYADEQYLRVEWTCTAKSWDGRYSSWMVENGSALMEFCVRKLEGFNMGW